MATDIIPIGDVQVAMDHTDDDKTFDDLATAAMDPVVALEAVTGMRADSLLYQFKVGGAPVVGFTVKGAKTMASRRGGFEIHAPEIAYVMVPVEDGEGAWIDVPGVRATVRVTDKRNDNTFCAVVARPRVKVLRDGTRKLDEHAEANAVSRAVRNAIMDHFWGVADVVKNFVVEAQKAGAVYVAGKPDTQMEQVSAQQAANSARRRASRHTRMGSLGERLFLAEIGKTAEEAGVDVDVLRKDLGRYMADNRNWAGLKVADIPTSDKPLLDAWLTNKRIALGLAVDDDTDTDDATPLPPHDPETGEIIGDYDDEPESDPEPEPKPAQQKTKRTTAPPQTLPETASDDDQGAAY